MNEESLNKSVNVVLPNDYKGGPVEVVIRHGEAPDLLAPSYPVKTNIIGVISAPLEYLKQRVGTGQFDQKRCHIIVDRDKIKITLIINEDIEEVRGTITGSLAVHPKFEEFGINGGTVWSPADLGMFLKMNRAFFPDKSANMKLVSELMNFTATVNNKIERQVKENGNNTDNFSQVVNSNLPEKFTVQVPLFRGMPAETIEVETFARINGREVAFILLSPGANQTTEEIRDNVIDEQLDAITQVAPDIVIIEV